MWSGVWTSAVGWGSRAQGLVSQGIISQGTTGRVFPKELLGPKNDVRVDWIDARQLELTDYQLCLKGSKAQSKPSNACKSGKRGKSITAPDPHHRTISSSSHLLVISLHVSISVDVQTPSPHWQSKSQTDGMVFSDD
jgi:hypothetical protein